MPTSETIQNYAIWYQSLLAGTHALQISAVEIICPDVDVWRLDHPVIQKLPGSIRWRFRPSVIFIVSQANQTKRSLHIMNAVSGAISLKDLGEIYCYATIMNVESACVVSPKGVSNEVRIVQADTSIRDRLFRTRAKGDIFLAEWNIEINGVNALSVIPIEMQSVVQTSI